MDLAGTEALHGAPPAVVLARFADRVEREVGITVSIGLSANRLMAKIAVETNKPRGFATIGGEAREFLAPQPVRVLPGIGPALARRLEAIGITRLGHLQALSDREAIRQLGEDGPFLVRRARGEDVRAVHPGREAKSISAESTFADDLTEIPDLEWHLWRLTEKLARRLKEHDLAAAGIVLKLKTARFAIRTRAARLAAPTVLPDLLFGAARGLLANEATGTAFRLIGIGASALVPRQEADRGDLADTRTPRLAAAQAAIDTLRARYGENAVIKGRVLRGNGGPRVLTSAAPIRSRRTRQV